MNNILTAYIVALGIAAALPSSAHAQADPSKFATEQTLYVDANRANANDDNLGTTPNAPLKTISAAVAKATEKGTRILIAPGQYREYIVVKPGDNALVFEPSAKGDVVVSGSDVFSGWKAVEGGVFTHEWPNAWGLGTENGWWGSTAYNRRREMIFVNGARMTQRCDDAGNAVPSTELKPGEFTVADASDATPGTLWLRPPAGTDVNKASIEVAVRGFDRSLINESRPLMYVEKHSNVSMRGLTFQHCANSIKFAPALNFFGTYPGRYEDLPENVLIEDCAFVENNAIGMEVSNYRNVTVRRSRFNQNGARGGGSVQLGVEADRAPVGARNFLYEDCQFNENNWRMVGTWGDMNDSAGYKMFGYNIDSYRFVRCQFNRNLANGFWQDYGGSNVTLDHCIAEENRGGGAGGYGVLNEMTRGPFTVRDSVIRNNGNSGFISSGAPNVTLERNAIYYNRKDVMFNGQRLYGHEIRINSDTQRDSADFDFSLKGWKLTGNLIASFGMPIGRGGIFEIGGEKFPNGRTPAEEFAQEVESDYNTFSKDPKEQDYFPGKNILYSFKSAGGSPDIDLATWQKQKNVHGFQDTHSKFTYPPNLSAIKDPTQSNTSGYAMNIQ